MSHDAATEDAWAPKSARYKLTVAAILVGSLVAFAVLAWLSRDLLKHASLMLSTRVEGPDALSEKAQRFLDEEILEEYEAVVWYYSVALVDMHEDGNLLTDRRLVSYWTDEDTSEFYVESLYLSDLAVLRVDFAGTGIRAWEDTTLMAWRRTDSDDGETEPPLILYLSSELDRDHRFVQDTLESARLAGADVLGVELAGSVSPAEVRAIPGGTPFEGDDIEQEPAVLGR